MASFLKDDGKLILSNGYKICFLRPSVKYPIDKGWQKNADRSQEELGEELNHHLMNGRAGDGIGILTKYTPFIDLDFKDIPFLRWCRDWIVIELGFAPCRIGNPPKRGFLFRLEGAPFKKMSTPAFIDDHGNKAQVEILADGQQFASNHIHPDIKKPYEWIGRDNPMTVPVDKLPAVTEGMMRRFRDAATAEMKRRGWKLEKGQEDGIPAYAEESTVDEDEDLSPDSYEPLGLGDEQIRKYVFKIPNSGEASQPYEPDGTGKNPSWLAVMAGINHEDSTDVGKEIAREWSQQSHKHDREPGKFEKTWRSFNNGTQRRLVTFRAIIKWAKEADRRPVIFIEAGELTNSVQEAEAALIAAKTPIYARGPDLVRPVVEEVDAARGEKTNIARLHTMSAVELFGYMSNVAIFERFDVRANKRVRIDPPMRAAELLLASEGSWRFPKIVGVSTTQTLRPDGSLLIEPGYDPATKLLLLNLISLPQIIPTEDQARKAAAYIEKNFVGFEFMEPESLTVAMSSILTTVLRGAIPTAPMHHATAPTPGTGKSFLWDVAAMVATGQLCPVIAPANPEELEKRLHAILLAGKRMISIDNVDFPIRSAALNTILTQRSIEIRILGETREKPVIDCGTTIMMTGNNVLPQKDLLRRTLVCWLDAKVERPELRQFAFNPVVRASQNRGKFIAAALTIARWYIEAGFPGLQKNPLGSFEDWDRFVRSPLVYLGYADPVATIEKARAEDPELRELDMFLTAWVDELGCGDNTGHTAVEIVEMANVGNLNERPKLHEAVREILKRKDESYFAYWLRHNKGRPVNGLRIVSKIDPYRKLSIWYVERVRDEL